MENKLALFEPSTQQKLRNVHEMVVKALETFNINTFDGMNFAKQVSTKLRSLFEMLHVNKLGKAILGKTDASAMSCAKLQEMIMAIADDLTFAVKENLQNEILQAFDESMQENADTKELAQKWFERFSVLTNAKQGERLTRLGLLYPQI